MIIDVSKIDLAAVKDPVLKAVLICLFTDAYVPPEELPAAQNESRGWWGDYFDITVNGQKRPYTHGSRLWLYGREKLSDETVSEMKEHIKGSLNVLLEASVLKAVDVTVTRISDGITFTLKTDRHNITFEGL